MSNQLASTVDQDADFNFRPYIETLWRYRRIVVASVVAALVIFGIGAGAVYLLRPSERTASIGFRLIFPGAEAQQYPNGTPFDSSEIIAAPVLEEVYRSNDLSRYGTTAQWRQTLMVHPVSPALRDLDDEYETKLSSPRLGRVERAKLEEEFQQKRAAIHPTEFRLVLQRRERIAAMPTEAMQKALGDTLATWARQAAANRGATRPNVDLVSPEVFARATAPEQIYLVRVEALRAAAQRIASSLTALQEVPGARTLPPEDRRRLSDEIVTVENILRFDIDSLRALARVTGNAPRGHAVLTAYLSQQLVRYRLDYRQATLQARAVQTALREYAAARPGSRAVLPMPAPDTGAESGAPSATQVNTALIERFVELSAASQASDLQFRRSLLDKYLAATEQATAADREIRYYQDLLNQAEAPARRGSAGIMNERFTSVVDALTRSVDVMHQLSDMIASRAMGPSPGVYAITQPFRLETLPAVVTRRIVVGALLVVALALVGAVVGAFAHDARRQRRAVAQPSTY